ncbi:MAG: pilus assembly protein [Anaerolineae bacterium]|nr:pilus assembly protein [Anaerolineae bacterium]
MTHRRPARRAKSKGQGLVEFALVLPILLLLLMGVVDFGWIVFNYAQLQNSLREALRYGSVPGYDATPQYVQCDGIRQRIIDLAPFSGVRAANISVTYDDGRPVTTDNTLLVGACPAGGSYSANTAYVPFGETTAQPRLVIRAGDRVVIGIDVNVRFLTPFIHTLAPSGMHIQLGASRTIFPDGLGL